MIFGLKKGSNTIALTDRAIRIMNECTHDGLMGTKKRKKSINTNLSANADCLQNRHPDHFGCSDILCRKGLPQRCRRPTRSRCYRSPNDSLQFHSGLVVCSDPDRPCAPDELHWSVLPVVPGWVAKSYTNRRRVKNRSRPTHHVAGYLHRSSGPVDYFGDRSV